MWVVALLFVGSSKGLKRFVYKMKLFESALACALFVAPSRSRDLSVSSTSRCELSLNDAPYDQAFYPWTNNGQNAVAVVLFGAISNLHEQAQKLTNNLEGSGEPHEYVALGPCARFYEKHLIQPNNVSTWYHTIHVCHSMRLDRTTICQIGSVVSFVILTCVPRSCDRARLTPFCLAGLPRKS